MEFVLHPPPTSKRRVKIGTETGMEYEKETNPLDVSYLELLDEDAEARKAAEAAADEAPSTPLDALEKFTMALGEMDVIMDLASNLQASQVLDYKVMTGKARSSASALQDAYHDRLVRFGRRRQDLRDVSARLKQGAKDLRATADQDDDFYQQAAQLQRYWRLRANPRTAEHANSPFSVELNLTDQPPSLLVQHSAGSTAGAAAAVAAGAGGQQGGGEGVGRTGEALLPSRLALLQGPCGRLRVQVDSQGGQAAPSSMTVTKTKNEEQQQGPSNQPIQHQQFEQQQEIEQQPKEGQPQAGGQGSEAEGQQDQQQGQRGQGGKIHVAVGTRNVHCTLLSMQSRMLWHMVEGLLDDDARSSATRAANNFGSSLAHKAVSAMAAPHAEPWLAALRPLVLEHAITRLLPSASIAPPPRPPAHAPPAVHLLPSLAAWLHHAFFRSQLRARLDEQVQGMQDVSIHWVNCCHPFTSVLQIRCSHRPPVLLIAREFRLEMEGLLHRDGSKWSSMGRQSITRQELPQLLETVLKPP